jgi:thioredoxin 1
MEDLKDLKGLKGYVLIDFWASWCTPCKAMAPIIHDLDYELGNRVRVVKYNVDVGQIPVEFSIVSIPAIVLFKDNKEIDRLVGMQTKRSIIDMIKKHVKEI